MFDFFKKKKDPVEESGKLEMNKEMFFKYDEGDYRLYSKRCY